MVRQSSWVQAIYLRACFPKCGLPAKFFITSKKEKKDENESNKGKTIIFDFSLL